MTRTAFVSASLAVALAAGGCGHASKTETPTIPASANASAPLPQVEPVRGTDYKAQALEGAIARFVQWGNRHYGKTVLEQTANNSCEEQVDDLWHCSVTIRVVKPRHRFAAGRQTATYTVTRDTEKNQLIYIPGLA